MIAAGVLAVGEVLTLSFLLLPFAVAALVGALAAGLGAGTPLTIAVFAVGSVLAFLLVRPIARRHERMPVKTRTGVAALPGQRAHVLEAVDGRGGRVQLAGEIWSATSVDGKQIAAGSEVTVIEIAGATAIVME